MSSSGPVDHLANHEPHPVVSAARVLVSHCRVRSLFLWRCGRLGELGHDSKDDIGLSHTEGCIQYDCTYGQAVNQQMYFEGGPKKRKENKGSWGSCSR